MATLGGRPPFGLRLPIAQGAYAGPWERTAGPESLTVVAREAERLGYSHISVGDHVVTPYPNQRWDDDRWLDPFVTLAILASVTTKIRLLTAVAVLPYRSPLVTAKMAATLDVLSKGRLILGCGAGYLKEEFDALGLPFSRRGSITDEYLAALTELWTSENASFSGKHCRFENITLSPKPLQRPHPPIWIGGDSPAALRRAATLGDGWFPTRLTAEAVRRGLQEIRSYRALGEEATQFQVTVTVWPLGGVGARGERGAEPALKPADVDVERLIEEMSAWSGAGATQVHVGFRTRDESEFLEAIAWFAGDVMGRWR